MRAMFDESTTKALVSPKGDELLLMLDEQRQAVKKSRIHGIELRPGLSEYAQMVNLMGTYRMWSLIGSS